MRKTQNTIVDIQTADNFEIIRRLYRGTTEVVKRLDEQKSSALTITDILTPSGEVLRCKLKDYCERLIIKDPVGHARKIEELLWRKAFYDVVSAAKKLRKGNAWRNEEKALLSTHLTVGVGFYHHLILRLQLEYGLNLAGVVDFAYQTYKSCLSNKGATQKTNSDETQQCVMRIVHRSLICLGDLARYRLDLEPNWDPMIAIRYYKMAIVINPNIGMPHNQLGTVAGNKNHGIDAVYHYMRCISCPVPFEGAEGNLKRIITAHIYNGKEQLPVQRCAARLFSLLRKWNSDSSNINHINEDCQNLLIDIENCLHIKKVEQNTITKVKVAHSIEEYLESCKLEPNPYLSSNIIFKIVAISLMSMSKLQMKESRQVQGIIAFILSLLSQLIQVTIDHIQEFIMNSSKSSNGERLIYNDTSEKLEVNERNHLMNFITTEVDHSKSTINDLEKSNAEKESINGHIINGSGSKPKDKSKRNLLTKLRRPRKRINSSDSDGSDLDGQHLDSSSEELNYDISETEGDEEEEEEEEDEDDVISDCEIYSHTEPNVINVSEENESIQIKVIGMNNKRDNVVSYHGLQERKEMGVEVKSSKRITDDRILDIQSNSSASAVMEIKKDSICVENRESISYIIQLKKNNLNPHHFFEVLSKEELFHIIKIYFDWLRANPDIIRTVTTSSRILLQRITILMNLINIDFETIINKWERDSTFLASKEKVLVYVTSLPLQEDIELRGLDFLKHAHEHIDWEILRNFNIRKQEEVLLRIGKLVNFGDYLCSIDEVGMTYDKDKNLYILSDLKVMKTVNHANDEKLVEKQQTTFEHPHGKLMRHMGKLWLKAEVRALESRLKSKLMSPYLVPDHEALAKHTPALKRLVYTKKFIVIIPSIVISALDEMKRTSGCAREATRWLEGQLQKGSRFLRAQRPHESLALPLIKEPRPKDKNAWFFFQIIECCHYFTQQTKVGLNNDTEPPMVTLLTGINNEERKLSTFSPNGLAKSAGVNLEHIESFHTKWKTSSKSHG